MRTAPEGGRGPRGVGPGCESKHMSVFMSPPHCEQHMGSSETTSLITPFIEGTPRPGRVKARADAHLSLGWGGTLGDVSESTAGQTEPARNLGTFERLLETSSRKAWVPHNGWGKQGAGRAAGAQAL